MKKFLALAATALCFMFYVPFVQAQYGQPSISYSILIDKMVIKPGTGDYVDNLSPSDPRYSPSQDVWFRVKLKNTSDQSFTAVTIKDHVPVYILPIQGPGSWDLENRIITWNAGDFAVDEEKSYYLKMRVYDQSMLPLDKGLFCIINSVEARNNVAYDDDSSQVCIEKTVTGVVKVPSAGPEMGILLLSGEMLALGAGLILKKTKSINKLY
ncbi:hypothetical protein CO166_02535 [Candidatus Roizmanbacteria bacterium CG_4_9_14_3_um_filter_36_11]|nr:MAG: hypothetical protein CO166_02535 [Candidatus Roizmanbacteria bacterium CG_4_9_14_3_um_filter_36_11]